MIAVNWFNNRKSAAAIEHEMKQEIPGGLFSKEAVDVINACPGCNIEYNKEGGKIEMRKAVEQFKVMVIADGRIEEKYSMLRRRLLKKFTVKDICAAIGVSTRTVRKAALKKRG